MKLPLCSLSSALAAVALVAIESMAIRSINGRPEALLGVLHFLVLGSLPMASLLLVGIARLIQRRARSSGFLLGFEMFGWMAFSLNIAGFLAWPLAYDSALASVLDVVGEVTGWDSSPRYASVETDCFVPILLLLPLASIVLVGGWVGRRIPVGRATHSPETAPGVETSCDRIRPGLLIAMRGLSALPVLVIEGVLRWTIDPKIAQLSAGSEAILCIEDSMGYHVPFPNGAVLVPCGTRLRVDHDGEESWIGTAMTGAPGQWATYARFRSRSSKAKRRADRRSFIAVGFDCPRGDRRSGPGAVTQHLKGRRGVSQAARSPRT